MIHNWDRTQFWSPRTIHAPRTEDELGDAIRRAAGAGRRLKAHGGALSWSDIIDVPDGLVRLDRMNDVIEVDREHGLITVAGGARMRDLHEVLAAHGLAFDNFGSIVAQTAAGYTGTGTHGTGGRTRILSSQIEHLRLVDGAGRVRELDATHEPDLFSAARVHLGCLGVVTAITFRCVDAFDLEERLELHDFDRALADLDQWVDDNDYCKLWWIPYTSKIQVYTFNRTTRPRTRQTLSERLDASGISGAAYTALLGLSRRAPAIIQPMNRLIQRLQFRPHTRVDRSDRIIRVATSIPRHQETEYAIPRSRAAAAVEEVRRMVERARYCVNFPMEIRFVAADDIPMSPASGRDSCYLGAYVSSVEWAAHYFADFETLMHDHDGRPHWGKSFTRTARQLRRLYPGYDRFAELRRACDPADVFRNAFVDRVFPASS